MIEEYVVYINEHEVLVQATNKRIISTGPLLRDYIGKTMKYLQRKAEASRWVIILIQ